MKSWLKFGGQETPDSSTLTGRGRPEDFPRETLRFLEEKLLPGYETRSSLFVHATQLPHLPLNQLPGETLYWNGFEMLQPQHSGKTILCGDTAQKSGRPAKKGDGICLITWAYGRGWQTCQKALTGQYWQANQAGAFREGTISPDSVEGVTQL